jgi:hypothetical protein
MQPDRTWSSGPMTHGQRGVIVTPGASDLPGGPAKGIVLLTPGNVTVVPIDNADGAPLAFFDLPSGYVIPFRVRRVTAATASVAAIYD